MSFDRTPEQRIDALQKANGVRHRRAELKVLLKTDATHVFHVLAQPPEYALSMKVGDLLCAVKGVGPVKSGKVLNMVPLSPSKRLGSMTDHQRGKLANELRRAYSARQLHQRATRITAVIHSSTNVRG